MNIIVRCVVVLLVLAITVSCRPTSREFAATAGSRAPNTAGVMSSTDDLKDKRIAVQLGTVYDLYAASTFPGVTVMQFNTFQEVTLAVSAGKADAGLSDIDKAR